VRLSKLARHVVGRAHAPGVPRQRLRPETEGAQRRAAARRVKRHVGIQQERYVVLLDGQVLLVNIGSERQGVEFRSLQQRPRRIVDHFAVHDVAGTQDIFERLTLRVFHDRVIKFPAYNEINVRAREQCFRGLDLHVRSDKSDLQAGLLFLHAPRHLQVAAESHGGSKQNNEVVVLGDADGFGNADVVRRRVQQPAAFEHSRGVGEPNRIPGGLDVPRVRPARACSAVELFKAWRIQEQRFHHRRHSAHPSPETYRYAKRPAPTRITIVTDVAHEPKSPGT